MSSKRETEPRPADALRDRLSGAAARYVDKAKLSGWDPILARVAPAGSLLVVSFDNSLSHVALMLELLDRRASLLVLPFDSPAEELRRNGQMLGAKFALRLDDTQALCVDVVECELESPSQSVVPQDACVYMMTSGSTGEPAIVARSIDSWIQEAARYVGLLQLAPHHHVLLACPIHHAYAMGWLWGAIVAGSTVELARPTQLGQIVTSLRNRATHCALTPAIASLVARRAGPGPKPKQLVVAMAGAGPVDGRLEQLFGKSFGIGLSRNYGSTQSGALIAGLAPLPPLCIGQPMPGLEVEGSAAPGKPFELKMRLEDTRTFETGDIVVLQDQGYHIVGRKTSAIRRGETWVSPFEIEAALLRSPLVKDCQVRGCRPRTTSVGDSIIASVVPNSGWAWDEAELRAHCLGQLRESKVPDVFEKVTAIRRTPGGKPAPSPIYRLADSKTIVEAAMAYKRSVLLFALLETEVLEHLAGQLTVDQIALATGLQPEALTEMLSVAECAGLVKSSPNDVATGVTEETLAIASLEAASARNWNTVADLSAILRDGLHRRPFALRKVPETFRDAYQRAMNGPHKQLTVRHAVRQFQRRLGTPFRCLDISGTAGAYSRFLREKGLVSANYFVPVGDLDSGAIPAGAQRINIAQAIARAGKIDVLVLDNAIHQELVAGALSELVSLLPEQALVVIDDLFPKPTAEGAAVGVDWLTHGGTAYLLEEAIDHAMAALSFKCEKILRSEQSLVHCLKFYLKE